MKSIFRILFILSATMVITSFSDRWIQNTYSLVVDVSGLRNSKGILQVALYNKEGSVPDEHYRNYFRLIREEINEDSAKLIFTDLPEGKYAVNVLHDENNNGKIDKGLILPEEGIGFSNYESIGLRNKPSFEKASFDLSADKSITVKIIYM
ncbi:MAG: DUF2141 domain-containing protein [Cyclobacteriaceae bacterium]